MGSSLPQNRRECFGWELNPDQHSPLWPMRWTMSRLAWGFLRKNARSTHISHWHAAVEAPARLAGKMETAQTRTFSTCRKNCQLCPLPIWYHDGPRVLSIPEPTITWRLTLYKDCTLCAELTSSSTRIVGCLVGINAGIGQNGIIQLRTSGHRRSQLSSGIDSLRLHTRAHFPR